MAMDGDPFDLSRFVDAQAGVFERAEAELLAGRKRSHWMWFIFPQMRGLGVSQTAYEFGITGRAEAEAYLAHPVLGPRLVDVTRIVVGLKGRSAYDIFGSPDDLKFKSSMTLFAAVVRDDGLFDAALSLYFNGERDTRTLELLGCEA